MTTVRIIGPGRAGLSLAQAFQTVGVEVKGVLGRDDDISAAAEDVDLVLLAVPDRQVAAVASSIRPVASTVLAHCAGALGLDALAPHRKTASLHPLVTLPDPVVGAGRLCSGVYFAVAGDDLVLELVQSLGGRALVVAPEFRATYHAAACMASNHLVALLGQVQRVAASVGIELEAFLPLAQGALEDVARVGPKVALTGPAARGDLVTIERHRRALDPAELAGYDAAVALARRLANLTVRPRGPKAPPSSKAADNWCAKADEVLTAVGSWN